MRAGAAPALVTERLRPARNSAPRPEGPLHCSLLRFSYFCPPGPTFSFCPGPALLVLSSPHPSNLRYRRPGVTSSEKKAPEKQRGPQRHRRHPSPKEQTLLSWAHTHLALRSVAPSVPHETWLKAEGPIPCCSRGNRTHSCPPWIVGGTPAAGCHSGWSAPTIC